MRAGSGCFSSCLLPFCWEHAWQKRRRRGKMGSSICDHQRKEEREQLWMPQVIARKGAILRAVRGKWRGYWGPVEAGCPLRGGKLGCWRGYGVRIMSGNSVQGQPPTGGPLGRPWWWGRSKAKPGSHVSGWGLGWGSGRQWQVPHSHHGGQRLPGQESQDLSATLFHHSSLPRRGCSLTLLVHCSSEVTKPGTSLRNINVLILSIIQVSGLWDQIKAQQLQELWWPGLSCVHQVTGKLGENQGASVLGCFVRHFHQGRQN